MREKFIPLYFPILFTQYLLGLKLSFLVSLLRFGHRLTLNLGSQTRKLKPLPIINCILLLVFMAFSSTQLSSKVGGLEEEEVEEFDLFKCSTVDKGKKQADVQLPTGYRFDPSDDEIIIFYLFNKIMDRAQPITDVIKEIDVYEHDPDQLPNGDFKHGSNCNEAYYFTYIEPIYGSNGRVTRRTTAGGYWEVIGEEEEVRYESDNGDVTVGYENYMVFDKGQAPNGTKTPFVMHEYRVDPRTVPAYVLNDSIRTKIERYVVCRIINKEVSNYQPTFNLPPGLFAGRVEDEGPN